LQEGQLVDAQRTSPDGNGFFQIEATVNPGAEVEDFPLDNRTCGPACHYPTDFNFPAGKAILEIVATDPDGQQASIQRNIAIDRSGYATVPVRVVMKNGNDWFLANIPIQASTRLYLWRTRYFNGVTNINGHADIKVEALALSPTRYVFSIEPTIVDGVLYESIDSVEVILPPDATSALPVMLRVQARNGLVRGILVSQASIPSVPIDIWVIHLPDGTAQKISTTQQGTFFLENIPLSQYLFTADPISLISQGYLIQNKTVDLTTSLDETILLSLGLISGDTMHGFVHGKDGKPLPFAWVSLEKTGVSTRAQPDGEFSFYDLPPHMDTVVVNAPGYYSQAHRLVLNDEPETLDFELTRRPDTDSLPWGSGEIVIPSETVSSASGDAIRLETGWMWGNSEVPQPLVIWVNDVMISLVSGKFALERDALSGQAWLYVFDGEVIVRQLGHTEAVNVEAGHMVCIIKDKQPVSALLSQVVFSALHDKETMPISPAWEPTLNARMRDRLALFRVGTAQVITYLAYGLILISMVVIPIVGIYSSLKRRSRQSNKESDESGTKTQ
jgi:hypothetical protein